MRARRFNRYERKQIREEKLRNDMAGSGLYIYQNNTNADLALPKPTASGLKKVGPKEKFQGDSYYKKWCGSPTNLLRFVDTITPEIKESLSLIKEEEMPEKLILDQPDTITQHGKVEHLITEPANKLTETPKSTETLLTEDPLDGVEIILG